MADNVSARALLDTATRHILHLTNVSDGTGEAAVIKADASALAALTFKIRAIYYSTVGMGFKLLFDATTDDLAFEIGADAAGQIEFPIDGRIGDPKSAGFTGDMLLTTVGHISGDSYSIVLDLDKVVV